MRSVVSVVDDLEYVMTTAADAAALAVRMRAAGLAAERKASAADVVSAADRAAEQLILDRLSARFPSDGILGEEGAYVAGSSGRRWVLDPIDGTWNFLAGLPYWCTAIALEDEEGSVLAAVHSPDSNEAWAFQRGLPTFRGNAPVERLAAVPLSELSVATFLHDGTLHDSAVTRALESIVTASATVRVLGSGTVDLANVASGRLGLWIQYDCTPWDWFPGAALVMGAGGGATVIESERRAWHLAGNQQAVAEAERILRPLLR